MYGLLCSNCGGRIDVSPGFAKGRIRCPECGVYNEVPDHLRKRASESAPAASPATTRTTAPKVIPREGNEVAGDLYSFGEESVTQDRPLQAGSSVDLPEQAEEPDSRELLIQGTEEDDLNPYTVYADAPTKTCPHCSHRLPKNAVVCTKCGYHFEFQRPVKRRYEPIYRHWDNFWTPRYRVMAFVVLQILNFTSLAVVIASGRSPATMILTVVSAVLLQVFLCGTYDSLELNRTAKGKVTLRSHWRIAFVPVAPRDLSWKDYEGVTLLKSNEEFDFASWVMAIILFCYCVIPGVLFWYYVIHRDKYSVMLCRGHGFPDLAIYRTLDETGAAEVRDTISQVSGLPVQI